MMVGMLDIVKKELKKVPERLHGQEISSRLEMSPKRKPSTKARALSLKAVGGNESRVHVVFGKIQISLWKMLWLQHTLLKEKVLQEKAGISKLMLLLQSVQSSVRHSLKPLLSQSDEGVAFFDSLLIARLTSGS